MDIFSQINFFRLEIMYLLDQGKLISIEELEKISDEGDIVEYIGKTYGFKYRESIPDNQCLLRERLKEFYISEGDARKYCIENNGFVYLLHILFELLINDAYDYKWSYKELSKAKNKKY